jgi:AraC-like DNA-binding protein
MYSATADCELVRFSTDDVQARDRLPFWHDFFARKIVNVEAETQGDRPLRAEASTLAWPALRATWFHHATPITYQRPPRLAADGDDAFAFLVNRSGCLRFLQRGADVALRKGEAVGLLHAEPATGLISPSDYFALIVPRAALAPFVPDIEATAMRPIPSGNEALRLLKRYSEILREDPIPMTPELRHVVTTHIYDLIALTLGPTRDGAAVATTRGLRAARLRAVKADILDNLGDPELTVTAVALRQRVTPRYIHMLLATEGLTFSTFVLSRRLAGAHRLLSDPGHATLSVSSIAYATGFGDLSYFNRTFRRRFGATPSELREASRNTG